MDKDNPRYTRETLLGEGGMGKVYLAHDNQLQRKVAIKELSYFPKAKEAKDKEVQETQSLDNNVNNALNEARLLARFNHPNIIQIHNIENSHSPDKSKNQSDTALVMEYFDSKTLTKFQNEHHPTLIQKLDLLCQLAAGLAAAHKNKVIHCDLKPNNILVNNQGQLKITDFGIACLAPIELAELERAELDKATLDKIRLGKTTEPAAYGSVFYMSPEQIKQQPLDYRTDIFSLGIVAYQLIVGSHPFAGRYSKGSESDVVSEIADSICHHNPEHAENLMLDAPKALTDLLMAMLTKPVEQRTLTAAEIEKRLSHIKTALMQADMDTQVTVELSTPSVVLVPPITLAKRAVKSLSSSYLLCSFIILIVALLVALAAWFYTTADVDTKQIVILRPVVSNSPELASMQQDLVISAVEDALRQSVINTKHMFLILQREVNAITKAYPDDLKRLKQAVGATDIISTTLECDNTRCKVGFSRLVSHSGKDDLLAVEAEKNWLVPIEKFSVIYSNSQAQFASLYPELSEVNQAGLVQRSINEEDYRDYIEIYSEIKKKGDYNAESLTKLEALLTRTPYLYAGYGLFRLTALDLYLDSQDNKYLSQLDILLKSSPPEYRYSTYEAVDRFWLSSYRGEMALAKSQIDEAKKRGSDDLSILELEAYMLFNSGKYKKAAEAYSNAFRLRSSSGLLYNIALSYWHYGDLAKVHVALNRMLKILPEHYQAQRLQANVWLLQGKLEKAIVAYESMNSKNNFLNSNNLSIAYSLNHQYEKALKYAKLSVSESPKNTIRLLNLADVELIIGDSKSANANYQKIIDSPAFNNQYGYWLDLAQAYVHLGNNSLAVESLSRAKTLAPENGEVAYSSALIYSHLDEKTSAVLEVKKALSHNVGAVWFNLPWFDKLCDNRQFQTLMTKYDNEVRCLL
jgi:serine/threonine protein kinase/tetratricopeptide (TPR) repeat protein